MSTKAKRANDRDHGRYAAGLFAATVVITGGAGICIAIAAVSAPDLTGPLMIVGGSVCGLVFAICMLLARPVRRAKNSNLYTAELERFGEHLESFRPPSQRRRGRDFGTNKPPSADDLRQIKEDSNAWHPSKRRMETYRQSLQEPNET
jgi:hypothetical protein